jgi:transposase-like protein
VLVQNRRDTHAAKWLLRKLVKKQMQLPRVMIIDKPGSYGAAKRQFMPGVEHGRCRRTKKVVDPAQLFPTKPLIAALLLPDLSGSANAYIR